MPVEELISNRVPYQIGETHYEPDSVRCHVAFVRESDGTFSAIVLNLPGVGSCGDTEEDALENVREAVSATVRSFIDDNEEIPWLQNYSIPSGAKLKWILVNV